MLPIQPKDISTLKFRQWHDRLHINHYIQLRDVWLKSINANIIINYRYSLLLITNYENTLTLFFFVLPLCFFHVAFFFRRYSLLHFCGCCFLAEHASFFFLVVGSWWPSRLVTVTQLTSIRCPTFFYFL